MCGPMKSRQKMLNNGPRHSLTQDNTTTTNINSNTHRRVTVTLPTLNEKKMNDDGKDLDHEHVSVSVRGRKNTNDNNVNNDGATNAKSTDEKNKALLKDLYHSEANCRFIYANPDGYAAVDGVTKGGYLIRATKHVFNKQDAIENENLDSIVNQIRCKTKRLVGTQVMELIQDVNQMNLDLHFKKVL